MHGCFKDDSHARITRTHLRSFDAKLRFQFLGVVLESTVTEPRNSGLLVVQRNDGLVYEIDLLAPSDLSELPGTIVLFTITWDHLLGLHWGEGFHQRGKALSTQLLSANELHQLRGFYRNSKPFFVRNGKDIQKLFGVGKALEKTSEKLARTNKGKADGAAPAPGSSSTHYKLAYNGGENKLITAAFGRFIWTLLSGLKTEEYAPAEIARSMYKRFKRDDVEFGDVHTITKYTKNGHFVKAFHLSSVKLPNGAEDIRLFVFNLNKKESNSSRR
jgi:hypothetical protein